MDPFNSRITSDDNTVDLINPEGPQPGIQESSLTGGERKVSPLAKFRQILRPTSVPKPIVDPSPRVTEITKELDVLADPVQEQFRRIKERTPEDIQANANRALSGIEDWFVADRMSSSSPGLGRLFDRLPGRNPEARFKKELADKAARFQNEYEQTVFAHVEHSTRAALPNEVELKSPGLLAKEAGVNVNKDNTAHSGDLDIQMGNTDYIFACFYDLPSRSFSQRGPNYTITSQDAYVVPVDHADLKVPEAMLIKSDDLDVVRADYSEKHMKIYADNIYTFKDFKKVFSYFSAAFFDKPERAVQFFKQYAESKDIERADFWESDFHWGQGGMPADEVAKENKMLGLMKELVIDKGIFPPFAPEVQFKDKVSAKRKAA